jgi:choice-of-anchor A domain-containing protein
LTEWTAAFQDLNAKSKYWSTLPPNMRFKNEWSTITVSAVDDDSLQVLNVEPGMFDYPNTYGQEFY